MLIKSVDKIICLILLLLICCQMFPIAVKLEAHLLSVPQSVSKVSQTLPKPSNHAVPLGAAQSCLGGHIIILIPSSPSEQMQHKMVS